MLAQPNGILVTGTDTGIGKTMVACAIVAALRARGIRVGVYKPAETGCGLVDGVLAGVDCIRLAAAGGGRQMANEVASYLFELPAAPLVAADAAGSKIDPLALTRDFQDLSRKYERVIVEGAGGLMVPIADGYTYLDLAGQLRLSVVCVVGSRLGCINHALLSLAAVRTAGLRLRGYIVNCLTDDACNSVAAADTAVSHESNRRTIARFTREQDLGMFPFVPDHQRGDYEVLRKLAERHLRMDALT
jgi:dethiobiotin synthetase